jgi:hypothetical protein
MITGFRKLTLSSGNGKLLELLPIDGARFNIVGQVQGRAVIGFTDGTVFVPISSVLYAEILAHSSGLPCCADNADDITRHSANCPRLR